MFSQFFSPPTHESEAKKIASKSVNTAIRNAELDTVTHIRFILIYNREKYSQRRNISSEIDYSMLRINGLRDVCITLALMCNIIE